MKMKLQELQQAIKAEKASKEKLEILLENVNAALENKTKELEKVLKDQEKIIATKTEELRKALDLAQLFTQLLAGKAVYRFRGSCLFVHACVHPS